MSLIKTILNEAAYLRKCASTLFDQREFRGDPTVMLYPGYFLTSLYLNDLAEGLAQQGEVPLIGHYPFWQDLQKTVFAEGEYLDRICQKKGNRVSLIGHSLGGLVVCSLAQEYSSLVEKVIAVGSPFQGTNVAKLKKLVEGSRYEYLGESCAQMLPGSKFLTKLAEKGFSKEVEFYALVSRYDFLIRPWQSAFLPQRENCTNFILENEGHTSLLARVDLIGNLLRG